MRAHRQELVEVLWLLDIGNYLDEAGWKRTMAFSQDMLVNLLCLFDNEDGLGTRVGYEGERRGRRGECLWWRKLVARAYLMHADIMPDKGPSDSNDISIVPLPPHLSMLHLLNPLPKLAPKPIFSYARQHIIPSKFSPYHILYSRSLTTTPTKMSDNNNEKKSYHKKATGEALKTVETHAAEHNLKLYGSCFW
jgi:hypothetical protein